MNMKPTFELYAPPMTAEQFDQLLVRAPKGFPLVYHIGNLMEDRLEELPLPLVQHYPHAVALHKLAAAAWYRSERGQCYLVQKRLGPQRYEYRAIKR